jgi:Dolichyl-phosphate-mannose-protein mannosyltransferase
MRSLQVGTATSGLWLGGLLALAVLTKYYSAVLVAVAVITVMLHPDRHRFLRSPAVPAAVAAGVLALVPHLIWAVNAEFPSVNYAVAKIRSDTGSALLASLISVVLGVLSLGGAAAGLLLLYGRNIGPLARSRLWANLRCPSTGWIVWLGVGPLLVSFVSAAVFGIPLTTHFLIPAFCMVPVAVLLVIDKSVTPQCEHRLAIGVVAVWALVIGGHASETVYRLRGGGAPPELRREIAGASERLFQLATGRPLRFVGGDLALATAIGFYGTEGAAYWENMAARATTATGAAEAGLLLACGATDTNCLRQLAPHARSDHRLFELSVERKDRARPGGVTKALILIVPPTGVPITWAARN